MHRHRCTDLSYSQDGATVYHHLTVPWASASLAPNSILIGSAVLVLSCCFMSHSTRYRSFRRRFLKPISWRGNEKTKLTQQKHTFDNQKKRTTTEKKHKKTKARCSRLLQHPAWKWSGSILKGKDK